LYNVGRRPQIWPTQKFWRGAPYGLGYRIKFMGLYGRPPLALAGFLVRP